MFKSRGVPDLFAHIECKRGTDRLQDSQREWEMHIGTPIVICYYPDPNSDRGFIFVGCKSFDEYLANPSGEAQANQFLSYAYRLEYGKPQAPEAGLGWKERSQQFLEAVNQLPNPKENTHEEPDHKTKRANLFTDALNAQPRSIRPETPPPPRTVGTHYLSHLRREVGDSDN
jgi:hypothetical protein